MGDPLESRNLTTSAEPCRDLKWRRSPTAAAFEGNIEPTIQKGSNCFNLSALGGLIQRKVVFLFEARNEPWVFADESQRSFAIAGEGVDPLQPVRRR